MARIGIRSPFYTYSPPAASGGFAAIAQAVGQVFGAPVSVKALLACTASTALLGFIAGSLRSRSRPAVPVPWPDEQERQATADLAQLWRDSTSA